MAWPGVNHAVCRAVQFVPPTRIGELEILNAVHAGGMMRISNDAYHRIVCTLAQPQVVTSVEGRLFLKSAAADLTKIEQGARSPEECNAPSRIADNAKGRNSYLFFLSYDSLRRALVFVSLFF